MRLLATVLLLAASPAMANVTPFKTPSGNIECTIGESVDASSDLRCVIFDRSGPPAAPRPAGCDGAWGHIFVLLDVGETRMECGAPGQPNTAPGVDVAAYGQESDWGGLSCASSAKGLECRNADGSGFFLSRARQTIFAASQGTGAQEWTPISRTAQAITGSVTISEDEIVFGNGEALPLRAVAPELYAVESSANPILLNGNSICGPRAPTYLAARRQGETLYLLAFDGAQRPSVSGDPLSQSGSCALYVYERAGGQP